MDGSQGGGLDLTFLDDLLGVEGQMVPVDDFFPQYVDELTNRSKRHAVEQGVGPFAKQFRGTTSSLLPISTPVHLSAPAADMHSLNLNLVTSNSLGTDAMLSEPTAPLPSATAPPLFSHARSGPGSLPFHDMAGAGVPATFGSAWPIANDVGDSYLAAGGSSSDGAGWAEAEPSRGPQPVPRAGSSGGLDGGSHQQRGTGRRISKKKQESNKAAQQRYREKKKAQFSEMEEKLEHMTHQLARMEALEQRNIMLEAQNNELERKLLDKEQEVDQLKLVIDRYADASQSQPAPDADACQEAIDAAKAGSSNGTSRAEPSGSNEVAQAAVGSGDADVGMAACASCVSCEVLPRDLASGQQLNVEVAGQVARLRSFLAEHKLHAVEGVGAGERGDARGAAQGGPPLPSPILRQLVLLVGRACQLCQASIKSEGVRVLDLVDSSPGGVPERVEGEAAAERWRHVLRTLRLTPGQAQQLLLLRQAHLGKMRGIYKERQLLNVQAMALMLPQAGKNPFDEDTAAAGGVGSLSGGGYLSVARSSAELGAILDQIKDNLRREQRAVMDLNCMTVSRILTPLQAAIYMVETYPQHCDALALSNVLAVESTARAAGTAQHGNSQ